MNIREFAKRLRVAADAVDAVLEIQGTPSAVREISKLVKEPVKSHWTQTKAGKEKLSKAMKTMWQKRAKNG